MLRGPCGSADRRATSSTPASPTDAAGGTRRARLSPRAGLTSPLLGDTRRPMAGWRRARSVHFLPGIITGMSTGGFTHTFAAQFIVDGLRNPAQSQVRGAFFRPLRGVMPVRDCARRLIAEVRLKRVVADTQLAARLPLVLHASLEDQPRVAADPRAMRAEQAAGVPQAGYQLPHASGVPPL